MKKEQKGAIWTACKGQCPYCADDLHPFLNFITLKMKELGATGMCKACHARLRRCDDTEQFVMLCAKAKLRNIKKGRVPTTLKGEK